MDKRRYMKKIVAALIMLVLLISLQDLLKAGNRRQILHGRRPASISGKYLLILRSLPNSYLTIRA
jgi:hypothetical protein